MQKRLAKLLGISQGYFSAIYNKKHVPSRKLTSQWKPMTKRTHEWFEAARVAEIQRLFNRIAERSL